MEFEKYYVVANTREQFLNEVLSSRVYNDHPSRKSKMAVKTRYA